MARLDSARRRQNDVRQDLLVLEDVLLEDVLDGGHREVVGGGNFTLAVRTENPELRAVRHQRHRKARRMDDVARAVVAEDRVVLVLAGDGKAARTALLEAHEFLVAVVPTARALVDVAADGTLVS